jgi:hypothetical protein
MSVSSGPSISVPTDTVRVFATSGTFTPAFTGTVEVLVVGGGGAGGGGIGGGGGGGGVVYMPAVSVTSGTPYTITVGAGGAAIVYSSISGSGGDSTAFGATAKGGGGSGVHDSGAGVAGGSGGGAASNNSVLNQGGASSGNSLGSNTGTIYGNRGGNMTATRTGGPTAAAGGGGAGAAAADTNSNTVQSSPGNSNGRGGAGIDNSILGTIYYWAGGGGGGGYYNGYAGDGGIGGGGGGSCSGGIGPTNGGGNGINSGTGAAIDTNGAAGAMNTGGGGGGGAWQVTYGGAGGSGIVIIRYSASLGSSTGGSTSAISDMVVCLDAGNSLSYPGTGTVWRDVSGNGNNGTLVNGVGYNSANLGTLVFDGVNDYVSVANNVLLRPASELTIEYVIKGTTPSSWCPILGYGNGDYTNGNYLVWVEGGDGALNSLCRINNGGTVTEYRQYSAQTISNSTFKYMTFTMKVGDAIRSYYNGASTGSATSLPAGGLFHYGGTTSPYQIVGLGGAWLNGSIPLVRLYNRALTAQEVSQNFNAIRGRFNL